MNNLIKLIVPTSATNGTVGATGAVTFTGVTSVSLNGCFSSTPRREKRLIFGDHDGYSA